MFDDYDDKKVAAALNELMGRLSAGWHKGIEINAGDIALLGEAAERLYQKSTAQEQFFATPAEKQAYPGGSLPGSSDPLIGKKTTGDTER